MFKAILLDLDDTLLGNSMDEFAPAYFQALSHYMADTVPGDQLLAALMRATYAMEAAEGGGATNEETCAGILYPALGHMREDLEPTFERFYSDEFPKLRGRTVRRPEARLLVEWAFGRGLQVVIATHPLFPRVAIEQRLEWAGVPVSEFDYDLVTSYEEMTCGKGHSAYYLDIVERLDREPDECLMVGDDWERDILSATAAGLHVYWITHPGEPLATAPAPVGGRLIGQGTLADFYRQMRGQ
jgi:FMN phosphatase YigB (HAD superfamily)